MNGEAVSIAKAPTEKVLHDSAASARRTSFDAHILPFTALLAPRTGTKIKAGDGDT